MIAVKSTCPRLHSPSVAIVQISLPVTSFFKVTLSSTLLNDAEIRYDSASVVPWYDAMKYFALAALLKARYLSLVVTSISSVSPPIALKFVVFECSKSTSFVPSLNGIVIDATSLEPASTLISSPVGKAIPVIINLTASKPGKRAEESGVT